MDFVIVSTMQMDFKLQVDQSKWSLQQFNNLWTSNGIHITNQPIQMDFVTI
jgi:hypothetical protein